MKQAQEMMSSMNDDKSGLGNIMGIADQLKNKLSSVTPPK